ncbi:MAG: DUF1552 domain-containing protein [Luteolibacter sp.]
MRSTSALIALPFLEAFAGRSTGLMAATTPSASGIGAMTTAAGMPKRLVFLPMGYGVNAENWFPSEKQQGSDYELPPLVQGFEDLKSDISFVQNLECARIPHPHAGTANFLTCFAGGASRKDYDYTNTVSCDQLAAEVLGKSTRFDHMSIGNPGRVDGHGGMAAYDREGKPVGVHRTMTDLYTSLFSARGQEANARARLARDESSLDALLSDAKKLNRQVSIEDRDRVDEYFTSLRNIEKRLAKAQDWEDTPFPDAPFAQSELESSTRHDIELVFDMMIAAMKTDSTRVMSYMMPTQAVIPSRGMNPHRMSHQASGAYDPKSPKVHQARDIALSNFVAGFLRKMKETKDADGSSLLDNSLVAYGSCLRQGHAVSNGPLLLAGHGGGGIKQGQNLVCSKNSTPLANLWLSMIRHVGVPQDTFANSTGVIKELGFA